MTHLFLANANAYSIVDLADAGKRRKEMELLVPLLHFPRSFLASRIGAPHIVAYTGLPAPQVARSSAFLVER